MMKYEYLEHTADVKFLAYGKNLEEAFVNAAIATTNVMTDVSKVEAKIEKEIKLEAKNMEALLFDFFDEMIYLLDTEGFLVRDVKDLKIIIEDKCSLSGTFVGDIGDNYDVKSYIKAPTYNDMFIKEEDGKVTIQAVHDI